MAVDKDIAGWIYRQLRRRGWKAADLVRESGIGSGRISEWMNGRGVPSPDNCIRLAETFNVDPDDVLALAGHRIPHEPFPPDDEISEIEHMMRRMRKTGDRVATIRAIVQMYLETDRDTQEGRVFHAA